MERNYFANNLRFLRKAHKMTLKDVAEKLDVSISLVHLWENGKREPVLDDVVIICSTLLTFTVVAFALYCAT